MQIVAPTQFDSKPLSLGFLGLGWIGRNRMEVLLKNTNSRAIALGEPIRENMQQALLLAKSAKEITNSSEMVKQDDIDGIVIATPSAMHAHQCVEALKSGKAVFCQKPLGRTLAEVDEIMVESSKANKLLTVDLSYRYTKALQAIRASILNNELGKIYAVNLVFHNAYGPDKPWFYNIEESGGGCVIDLGIHLIDLALWNLDFPETVVKSTALFHQGRKLSPTENVVEDFAHVTMLSQQGTHINLSCSWNISAGRDAVIEASFYGTKASATFKNLDGSFYDFTAEKHIGTTTEVLQTPPDNWSGRAGVNWAKAVKEGKGYDAKSAKEYKMVAKIIDGIYGR